MNGIANQGQGAKAKANHQLQGREAAVEDHAPAKGRRRTSPVLVLALVGLALDHHSGMEILRAAPMPMVTGVAVVVIGTVGALLGSHGRFLSEKGAQRQALRRP